MHYGKGLGPCDGITGQIEANREEKGRGEKINTWEEEKCRQAAMAVAMEIGGGKTIFESRWVRKCVCGCGVFKSVRTVSHLQNKRSSLYTYT